MAQADEKLLLKRLSHFCVFDFLEKKKGHKEGFLPSHELIISL